MEEKALFFDVAFVSPVTVAGTSRMVHLSLDDHGSDVEKPHTGCGQPGACKREGIPVLPEKMTQKGAPWPGRPFALTFSPFHSTVTVIAFVHNIIPGRYLSSVTYLLSAVFPRILLDKKKGKIGISVPLFRLGILLL